MRVPRINPAYRLIYLIRLDYNHYIIMSINNYRQAKGRHQNGKVKYNLSWGKSKSRSVKYYKKWGRFEVNVSFLVIYQIKYNELFHALEFKDNTIPYKIHFFNELCVNFHVVGYEWGGLGTKTIFDLEASQKISNLLKNNINITILKRPNDIHP